MAGSYSQPYKLAVEFECMSATGFVAPYAGNIESKLALAMPALSRSCRIYYCKVFKAMSIWSALSGHVQGLSSQFVCKIFTVVLCRTCRNFFRTM